MSTATSERLLGNISPALRARVALLIAQLRKLSEAKAGSLVGTRHTGKPESIEPPGTKAQRGRPDPDEWLLEWFLWKLETAPLNGPAREIAVTAATVEAEIRLSKRTHRSPADLQAGSMWGSKVDTEERDHRIASEYEGLTPFEVSVIELHRSGWCPEDNVRKVRRRAGRDTESGSPLDPDRLLKGDARLNRARELAKEGMTQRDIASRLGVSHPTVGRWLKELKEESPSSEDVG